ncbi:WXG100 family type VII secretion target [Mycobacterium sp. Aquia_216]|uniref:WXG100 family type VII secretion target n=1 Tax=Mycobacterium sp. Aquia_216 TaxID=2991729 RepID=UPI00227C20D5|nr:WXG100 family type VII secretion target [Mycobacterium sp. Aquia_216]WAJ45200.1 WXG100 family type VII secretion target [Mycobacterium sp. Aquia_216]
MSDQITYNHAAVSGLTGDIATQAAQLMEIHDDVLHITQSLTEFFQGHGATAFFDAQQQMLHGLQDMIQTVSLHGHTVNTVHDNVLTTDQNIGTFFV